MVDTTASSKDLPTSDIGMTPSRGATTLNYTNWRILYPNYIDSTKTTQMGRRIDRSKAVSNPQLQDMKAICDYLELPNVVEPKKAYPRDWLIKGRIRVQLKNNQGEFHNQQVPSKKALMLKMGELIPQLKSRVERETAAFAETTSKSSKSKKKSKR